MDRLILHPGAKGSRPWATGPPVDRHKEKQKEIAVSQNLIALTIAWK